MKIKKLAASVLAAALLLGASAPAVPDSVGTGAPAYAANLEASIDAGYSVTTANARHCTIELTDGVSKNGLAKENALITVTVTADAGYKVAEVTAGNAEVTKGENNTYTFIMPATSVQVSATVVGDGSAQTPKYAITCHGDVSVESNEAAVSSDVIVTVTKIPEGMAVGEVRVTGTDPDYLGSGAVIVVMTEVTPVEGTTDKYKFTMPDYDVDIGVIFYKAYTLSTSVEPKEGGTIKTIVDGVEADKAKEGAELKVVIEPVEGYEIDKVTLSMNGGPEQEVPAENIDKLYMENVMTMPGLNLSFAVTFKNTAETEVTPGSEEHTITVKPSVHGEITVDPTSAKKDTEVTITAKPVNGFKVGKITVSLDDGTPVTVTDDKFIMPDADVTVAVLFEELPIGAIATDPNWGHSGAGVPGITDSTPENSDSTPEKVDRPAAPIEFTPAEVVVDETFDEETAQVVNDMKIEAPEGTFAEDTQMNVKPDPAVTAANAFALDITFTLNGSAVQPANGATVTVSIPVPLMFRNVDESLLMVFHFDNGTYTRLNDVTVSGGVVSFKTNHFSTYVISTENLAASSAPSASNSNPTTGIAVSALPILAAISAVVIIKRKK